MNKWLLLLFLSFILGCTDYYHLTLESEVYCPECSVECEPYFNCLDLFDCNNEDDACAACHQQGGDCESICSLVDECSDYQCIEQRNDCNQCYFAHNC